uniref:Zinc finger protein n=1 Tax=Bursaphelenchus xylophilus TaxID=6326 RepID=A0A1I7RK91_BURXY
MEVHHLAHRHMNYGNPHILDGLYEDPKLSMVNGGHANTSPNELQTNIKTESASPSTSSPVQLHNYPEAYDTKPLLAPLPQCTLPSPSLSNHIPPTSSPNSLDGKGSKSHDRKRPYPCSMCSSRFGSKMELEEHQNSHTGQKPFECDVCQSRFNRRSTLWNHKRIHSDAKPFSCTVCHMTFKWKNSLKCHKEMHLRKNETSAAMDHDIKMLTYATAAKKKLAEQHGGTFNAPLQTTTNPNAKRRKGRGAKKPSTSLLPSDLLHHKDSNISVDLLNQMDSSLYHNPPVSAQNPLDFNLHSNNLIMQAIQQQQQRTDEQQHHEQQFMMNGHQQQQAQHNDVMGQHQHSLQENQGAQNLFNPQFLDNQNGQQLRLPNFLNPMNVLDFQQQLELAANNERGGNQLPQTGYMNAVAAATSNSQTGLADQLQNQVHQNAPIVNNHLDGVLNSPQNLYQQPIDPSILLNQQQIQNPVDYMNCEFALNPNHMYQFQSYHLDQNQTSQAQNVPSSIHSDIVPHHLEESVPNFANEEFQKFAKMLPFDKW